MRIKEILSIQPLNSYLQLIELLVICLASSVLPLALMHGDIFFAVTIFLLGIVYPIRRGWLRNKRVDKSTYSNVDTDEIEVESDDIACHYNGMDIPKWVISKNFGQLNFMCTVPLDEKDGVNIADLPDEWKLIYKLGVFG